eukprot:5472770-Pyramimonas_sp.AAC.1
MSGGGAGGEPYFILCGIYESCKEEPEMTEWYAEDTRSACIFGVKVPKRSACPPHTTLSPPDPLHTTLSRGSVTYFEKRDQATFAETRELAKHEPKTQTREFKLDLTNRAFGDGLRGVLHQVGNVTRAVYKRLPLAFRGESTKRRDLTTRAESQSAVQGV